MIFLLVLFVPIALCDASPKECCLQRGVSQECAKTLCDPDNPPGDIRRMILFEAPHSCQQHLTEIAECLADSRDTTECCHSTALRTDPDASSCFALCRGAYLDSERWMNFQLCISVNMDSMYRCISKSYSLAPTAPRNLRIAETTSNSIKLEWKKPSKNSDKVHVYKVHLTETSGKRHEVKIHDVHNSFIFIDGLKMNGKYSVYVVAHAKDLSWKSVPSEIVHFTTGGNDNGLEYKDAVSIAAGVSRTTLACRLKMGVGSNSAIVWYKMDGSSQKKLSDSRFKITTYSSEPIEEMPIYVVSSLEISNVIDSDMGTYRCQIKGQTNDFGEVLLTRSSFITETAPVSPPETTLECCSKSVSRSHCESVCSNTTPEDLAIGQIRPGRFLPRLMCITEFQSLLRCTLSEMNSAACCIRKKIPYYCLGLCDNAYDVYTNSGDHCLGYISEIYSCQAERVQILPAAVGHLKARGDDKRVELTWKTSADTEMYRVYYRTSPGAWKMVQTEKTTATIDKANQIAVISINAHGAASPNRIRLIDGEWRGSYTL